MAAIIPKTVPSTAPLPLDHIYAFWIAGMSCDGCSIAVTGATSPTVEDLVLGRIPGLPRVDLFHPVLAVPSGKAFVDYYRQAVRGALDAPHVLIVEGSLSDELRAGDGYWAALGSGSIEDGEDATRQVDGVLQPIRSMDWIKRLSESAAAVIAIGTCATWGGIPAASGNITGSMGLADFLGKDYRSTYGLPVINIPGCAPVGDNFTETVATILRFLQGIGPLPEFDALGRPEWLFSETVHRQCVRGGYFEEGIFAEAYGDAECLVELGCWGPVVQCNIVSRGAINHHGGCMKVGGPCIGCTMPGFPDKFAPFYQAAPGSVVSSSVSRLVGQGIRPLREMTQRQLNREPLWDWPEAETDEPVSGWSWGIESPGLGDRLVHFLYEKLQNRGGVRPKPGHGRPDGGGEAS